MLNLKDKELFDKKISLINNKYFRDLYIKSQQEDIDKWDIGLVALWNTPVMFYELKKQYPNKKFYYIEFEDLKDLYGVNKEEAIYIKDEEELAEIMHKFKNPKLLINPPYSIGGKIIAKCKETYPDAKYSILMPFSQYKSAEVFRHKLYEYIKTMKVVGGNGFGAVITDNNCIITLLEKPNPNLSFDDLLLQTLDQNYFEYYKWNIEHGCNYFMRQIRGEAAKPENLNIETDFLETIRCSTSQGGSGFGKGGFGYKWNVEKNTDFSNAFVGVISCPSAKFKEILQTIWYSNKKGKSLLSKVIVGTHMDNFVGTGYFALPQFDLTVLPGHQKALWDAGEYDAAVLAEMGLKWEGDKIVKA